MTTDTHRWWSVVPTGATLCQMNTMDGVALFAHGDDLWLVDLFTDDAVSTTQEVIDAMGYFKQKPNKIDVVDLLNHYASLEGVGEDIAAAEREAAEEIVRLRKMVGALEARVSSLSADNALLWETQAPVAESYGWWRLVPNRATVTITDPENGIMEITGPGAHRTTVVMRVNVLTDELLGVWAFY